MSRKIQAVCLWCKQSFAALTKRRNKGEAQFCSVVCGIKHNHYCPSELPPLPPDASLEYRDICGFHGYRVCADGSVWSFREFRQWKKLTPRNNGARRRLTKGYYQAVILQRDGKAHNRLIHILVLEAFVGPRPAGMECCHCDGDPTNNRLDNLRWDTRESNLNDKKRHGVPGAKLTSTDVVRILELRRQGVSASHLANEFNVTSGTIQKVVAGSVWKRVFEAWRSQ